MNTLDQITRSVEQLSVDEITAIVRRQLEDDSAIVNESWIVEPFNAGSIGTGTLGFLKVSGRDIRTNREWSMVVKAIDPLAEFDTRSDIEPFNSPSREIAAFRSGFLNKLDGQVRAAPCHGITEVGHAVLLWMEDLSDSVPNPWREDEFLIAARGFGYFNGSWTESSISEETWIDRNFVTNCPNYQLRSGFFSSLVNIDEDDEVRALANRLGIDGVETLHARYCEIVQASLNLPTVLCHNDVHSRNAFFRYERTGPVTYAIDWASTGMGPVGLDGGALAGAGTIWTESEATLVFELEPRMFEEYIGGLDDAGYKYRRDQVRLGYLSHFVFFMMASLVVSAGFPHSDWSKFLSGRFGVDGDEFLNQLCSRFHRCEPLIDEALSLSRQLG